MTHDDRAAQVRTAGFAHLPTALPHAATSEVETFRATWSSLERDPQFQDYTRRMRSATRYGYVAGRLFLCEDQAFLGRVHYDTLNYPKKKEPKPVLLPPATGQFLEHPLTAQLLADDLAVVDALRPDQDPLEISVHQFRVETREGKPSPTTAGVHQDGFRWIFMHYIGSDNCVPVVSTLYRSKDPASECFRHPMGQFAETLIVNDTEMHHAATQVSAADPQRPAYRDLLLVTAGEPNCDL